MSDQSFFGQQGVHATGGEGNTRAFQNRQHGASVRTGVVVKVKAVHGGGTGPAPTVDLEIQVDQMDGVGIRTPHGVINDIPCMRIQGGGNAIIMDPRVGDVGYLVVADRDISSVKANKGERSGPGSRRRHNLSDGVYMGAMLNPANPSQWVQWRDDGITIRDKNGNEIQMNTAGEVKIVCTNLNCTGDVIAKYGDENISLLSHVHGGITPGGAETDVPVPA